jgi:catechol-2,3-dioxygenase
MAEFIGVRHVGWGVKDPVALAAFYRDVLGMTVVTELPAASHMGSTVFLSRHPEAGEHHDLVFFSRPEYAHTAFEVATLGELLASYREVKDKGVPITFTFNHGVWLSFYIDDPEGHNLEFFWRTNVKVTNDYRVMPINLDRPEEEILREVNHMAEHFAGGARTTASEWHATQAGNAPQWGANQWNATQQDAQPGIADPHSGASSTLADVSQHNEEACSA